MSYRVFIFNSCLANFERMQVSVTRLEDSDRRAGAATAAWCRIAGWATMIYLDIVLQRLPPIPNRFSDAGDGVPRPIVSMRITIMGVAAISLCRRQRKIFADDAGTA